MAFSGKIYVAFDAAKDMSEYKKFAQFKQGDTTGYQFYHGAMFLKELDKTPDDVLKEKIQKNMDDADIVVILLSKTVKSMRRFVKWQIEYAIKQGKPIIAVNPNRIRSVDYDVCPTVLKSNLSIHIPFHEKVFELAVLNWPKSDQEHRKNEKDLKKTYKYANSVYEEILQEESTIEE